MLNLIKTRRSVRKFTNQDIDDSQLAHIIEAGTWAPSGLNNQPWKCAIIKDPSTKKALAKLTHYGAIIEGAPVSIVVLLDTAASYDRTKDVQAIGAFIQNMLLAIHALHLGGVWLGEILKNKEKILELLGLPHTLEVMAVIALGHPAERPGAGQRKGIEEIVILKK